MTEEKIINGKALYTPKGAAMEYGRVGCNFYTGCPHECEYCYLKRGAPSKQLGDNKVRLKKCFKDEADAARILCNELDKHLEQCQRYGIFLSFTTDPMIEETRGLTMRAISFAIRREIPVYVLTKCSTFIYDDMVMAYLENIPYPNDIHFGFTLTGRDDMEPKASSNLDRIEAMRLLHQHGFKTWASIEPVIDWTHSRMVVELSLDCCNHYKIGLRSGIKKDYYDLLQSGYSIKEMVEKIVSSGRTVYLKESTRKLLRQCFIEGEYERILSMTLDMDGNRIK